MRTLTRRHTGTVAASAGGLNLIARAVSAIASVVVALLLLGIVLVVLEANTRNDVVNWLLDAGGWLAGPFDNIFKLDGHKANVTVNWGLAAVIYSLVAGLIIRLVRR